MNILKYELRQMLPSTLLWSIALSFFGCVCITLFGAFTQDVNLFKSLFMAYSPEVLKAVGANIDRLTSLEGFYSFCFVYVVMCAGFFALYSSIRVISKECARSVQDYLYAKPLSRTKILFNKIFAVLISNTFLALFYSLLISVFAYLNYTTINWEILVYIHLGMYLTQLLFIAIGFGIGVGVKKIKSPISFCAGITSLCFLVQMINNLDTDSLLSIFSIFNYFDANGILNSGGLDWPFLLLGFVLCLSIFSIGNFYFNRKDL